MNPVVIFLAVYTALICGTMVAIFWKLVMSDETTYDDPCYSDGDDEQPHGAD